VSERQQQLQEEQQRVAQRQEQQRQLERQQAEQEQQRLEQQKLDQWLEQQRLQKEQEPALLTELQYVVQHILRGEYEAAVSKGDPPNTKAIILPTLRSSVPRNKVHLLPPPGGRGEFKRIVEQIPFVEKVCIRPNDWAYYLTQLE
jgi:hypothetical protein